LAGAVLVYRPQEQTVLVIRPGLSGFVLVPLVLLFESVEELSSLFIAYYLLCMLVVRFFIGIVVLRLYLLLLGFQRDVAFNHPLLVIRVIARAAELAVDALASHCTFIIAIIIVRHTLSMHYLFMVYHQVYRW
jgi:hypothetical protein